MGRSITDTMFTTVAGLPVHPLIVHLAVVSAPLAAVLLIIWALRPSLRGRIGLVATGTAIIAAGSVVIAKSSGESLLKAQGLSESAPGPAADHVLWADLMTLSVLALMVLAALLYVSPRFPGWLSALTRAGAVIAAVAVLGTAVLTGHAGAQLVWADQTDVSSGMADNGGEGQ